MALTPKRVVQTSRVRTPAIHIKTKLFLTRTSLSSFGLKIAINQNGFSAVLFGLFKLEQLELLTAF